MARLENQNKDNQKDGVTVSVVCAGSLADRSSAAKAVQTKLRIIGKKVTSVPVRRSVPPSPQHITL